MGGGDEVAAAIGMTSRPGAVRYGAMPRLVQIPEEALAALLHAAGRPESVETFLASAEMQAAIALGEKLRRRARAAYWSRFWLFFSAAVSWLGFVGIWDVEDLIAAVLLTGMTVVEFKVYRFFLAADPRAAIYGWWNQCLFAFLFAVYGAYHTVYPVLPTLATAMVNDPDAIPILLQFDRLFYAIIGLVGAGGQFALACYYRAASR